MAFPNDMSKIVEGLGKLEASASHYSADGKCKEAARNLIRKTYVLRKPAADAMASTTTAYTAADMIRMKQAGRVLGATVCPQAALTSDASNNATVSAITADGAAGAQVVAATLVTDVAGGSWVAGTNKTMALSATLASTRYTKGGVLGFAIAKGGTGVVVPACNICVDVEEEDLDGYQI